MRMTGILSGVVSRESCPRKSDSVGRSNPGSTRSGLQANRRFAVVTFVLLAAGGTAVGQLTPDDIDALRRQGEAEGWTFTVGENGVTGQSLDELTGLVVPDNWWVDARFDPCTPSRDLPDSFNWCDEGGCTSVKYQGGCGSCWAFATVGPLECNILIKDGLEVNLSEQWLVSCNSDGWDCGGGWWAHDYHEWKTDPCGGTGAVLESAFPYAGWDAPCYCPYAHEYLIDDWSFVGGTSGIPPVSSIKQAIMDHGPVTVGIHVNDAFHAYNSGVFNNCEDGGINHGVVLVGWDDNQGSNGVWYLRNSWGWWWGEDGYMRIEFGCNDVGYAAAYVDYPGTPPLYINLPDGLPRIFTPGVAESITVQIEENTDVYVAGTGQVHYRYDSGTWQIESLEPLGGDLFSASLPAAACDDVPQFYFSAQGSRGQVVYEPAEAPALTHTAGVGELVVSFSDDFEADQGWVVQNEPSLTDGAWERGVPVGLGDRGDPPTDFDGSGQCFLTGNEYGNSDVDDGYTRLISPAFDMSAGDGQVDYALWYTNDWMGNPNEDKFNVYVSNDSGTSWTRVKRIGPDSPPEEWIEYSFWVGDFVTPTSEVKIRFEASDYLNASIVEAGLDCFSVSTFECVPGTVVAPLPEDSLAVTCESDSECLYEARCLGGVCYAPKHRYLSIRANPEQTFPTARRVKLDSGEMLGWAGTPYHSADLWFADVVSAPVYVEQWPATVHVTGCQIATGHTYAVQAIATGQDIGDEGSFSEVLALHTPSMWGDTVSSCEGDVCKPPQGIAGLDDMMAAIRKYQAINVAPLTWLDIDPSGEQERPDQVIGLGDILACIDGFQGKPYPGSGPLGCP